MYRPIYHFLPEKNWMNDPNGVCYYKGEYHLFYQYNPTDDEWGNIHWGHAKSKDCVHWTHLPIALYPSHEKGEVHCFSGCVSIDGEYPIIYYTSVGVEDRNCTIGAEQWCAISKDDMITWEKVEQNPILTLKDHGDLQVLDWRDPFVWKEDDAWYMVLGASDQNRGVALLYRSKDQMEWEYLGILAKSQKEQEVIWECPNFFSLGEKEVLVYSPSSTVQYIIGTRNEKNELIPESTGSLDYSGFEGFYAPNSFVDGQNRRIMIGWLTENARGDLLIEGNWKGVQSLPRVLSIKNGILNMEPLETLKSLRGRQQIIENCLVSQLWKSERKGKAMEIICRTVHVSKDTNFTIEVFASEDRTEKTVIRYQGEEDCVILDRNNSSLSGKTHSSSLTCEHAQTEGGRLSLHIFIDYSTIEIFINQKASISSRVYPIGKTSENIFLNMEEGLSLEIEALEIYEMQGIW
jgi:beta-fructofuranosidase